MNKVFLGIGTNLGDRETNLKEAIGKIECVVGPVTRSSSVYETEPWGFKSDNVFLNIVVEAMTDLTPESLLDEVHNIETQLGRVRREARYTSRIIDIDILLFNDLRIENKGLIIPHPLMQERKFVLEPLCEIAPDLVHPVLKKSIASLLKICKDPTKVIKL